MMTSQEAKKILDEITQKHPQRWVAAVNTVLVELMQSAERQEELIKKVARGAFALAKEVKEMRGGGAPVSSETSQEAEPQSDAHPVEEAPAHEPSPDVGERVGADGAPLSPEQAALEAQMDAAIGASGGNGNGGGGGAPSRPSGGSRRGGRRAPAPPPPMATDPESRQASLEAQMDAAIGAMDKK